MYSKKSLIELGLDLLSGKAFDVVGFESYRSVFSLLGIDVSQSFGIKALKSVFSEPSDSSARYYSPTILSSKEINYPVEEFPSDKTKPFDIPCEGNKLTLLEKYGSFVAIDVDGYAQTSLYDLFKTAAAIQNCREKGEEPNPFLLVSADFSGIQDTVYTISSKGALKTLRARSFMLELLTEHIVYELLQASKSDRYAIIYSGGGGFSLLLPNNDDNVKTVKNYRYVLNRWAYTEFFGKLFIALDALECNENKLKCQETFKELRQTQADNLDKLKRRKFIKQLDELFTPTMPEQLNVQTECQITRRDDLLNIKMRDLENGKVMPNENPDLTKIWVSESCYHQFKLGDKLIDAHAIYRYKEKPQTDGYLIFKNINNEEIYYSVIPQNNNIIATWQINSWDNDSPTILYADYVRTIEQLPKAVQDIEEKSAQEENRSFDKKNTATFEGLAASSCGANLIGALRMDVDNMGNLFSEIGSLTELSTKSRMLNIFFKVYLNQICAANLGGGLVVTDIVGKEYDKDNKQGKPGRNVSVIYAGGDDLFILGAWDETIELAFDIQRCLALFSGGLGISGGLTLHQPKFPLYQMAKKSGEAEHVAKHDKDSEFDDIKKNRIALFHDDAKVQRQLKMQHRERYMLSMTWDLGSTFLLPLMETYRKCGRLNEIDGRQVLEIEKFSYQTIEKWFAVIEKYQESHKLYLPTMARVMTQVEDNLSKKESDIKLFKKLLSYLYTNEESNKNWISHLHIALNWLSYLRRTK